MNAIKRRLKSLLQKSAPSLATQMQIVWQRRHVERLLRRLGLPRLLRAYSARHGFVVRSGPFAGMKYATRAVGSALIPKLVGSYESELHGVLSQILATPYDAIVDIGCAEGYYAVGLALHVPGARVFAFDIDPLGRRLCRAMARANGVAQRVTVAGRCDAGGLQARLQNKRRALVVCDCEGCEMDLLQPERTPALRHADILVELHDGVDPTISRVVPQRFAQTHDLILVPAAATRDPALWPDLDFLDEADRRLAVSELRHGPQQQWAYLTVRSPAPGSLA